MIGGVLGMSNRNKLLKSALTFSLLGSLVLTGCSGSSKMADTALTDGYDYGYNSSYDYVPGVAGDIESIMSITTGLGASVNSSKSESSENYSEPSGVHIEQEATIESGSMESPDNIVDTLKTEKLVYTASINMETIDYDKSIQELSDLISQFGGLIQAEVNNNNSWYGGDQVYNVGNRSYNATIRIPTDNFNSFMETCGNIGLVTSKVSRVDNISKQYYDTENTLKVYKIELESLMDLLRQTTDIEHMITIEKRISELNVEIMNLTTQIQSMDMDVAYSTIDIRLNEVIDYSEIRTPESERNFFERVKYAFIDSWENFLFFLEDLVMFLIYNVWYIAILIIAIILLRKFKKHRLLNGLKIKSRLFKKKAGGNDDTNNGNGNVTT